MDTTLLNFQEGKGKERGSTFRLAIFCYHNLILKVVSACITLGFLVSSLFQAAIYYRLHARKLKFKIEPRRFLTSVNTITLFTKAAIVLKGKPIENSPGVNTNELYSPAFQFESKSHVLFF